MSPTLTIAQSYVDDYAIMNDQESEDSPQSSSMAHLVNSTAIRSPFLDIIPECRKTMRKLRKKIYKHAMGAAARQRAAMLAAKQNKINGANKKVKHIAKSAMSHNDAQSPSMTSTNDLLRILSSRDTPSFLVDSLRKKRSLDLSSLKGLYIPSPTSLETEELLKGLFGNGVVLQTRTPLGELELIRAAANRQQSQVLNMQACFEKRKKERLLETAQSLENRRNTNWQEHYANEDGSSNQFELINPNGSELSSNATAATNSRTNDDSSRHSRLCGFISQAPCQSSTSFFAQSIGLQATDREVCDGFRSQYDDQLAIRQYAFGPMEDPFDMQGYSGLSSLDRSIISSTFCLQESSLSRNINGLASNSSLFNQGHLSLAACCLLSEGTYCQSDEPDMVVL